MVTGAELFCLDHHGGHCRMAGLCAFHFSAVLIDSTAKGAIGGMKAFRNFTHWMGNRRRPMEASPERGPAPRETLNQLLQEGDRAVVRSGAPEQPFLNTSPLTHLVEGDLKPSD